METNSIELAPVEALPQRPSLVPGDLTIHFFDEDGLMRSTFLPTGALNAMPELLSAIRQAFGIPPEAEPRLRARRATLDNFPGTAAALDAFFSGPGEPMSFLPGQTEMPPADTIIVASLRAPVEPVELIGLVGPARRLDVEELLALLWELWGRLVRMATSDTAKIFYVTLVAGILVLAIDKNWIAKQ